MKNKHLNAVTVSGATSLLLTCILSASFILNAAPAATKDGTTSNQDIEAGQKIAFSRKKGNCLACHMIQGGKATGNIAPPLISMQARFPNKSSLRAQIWDATVNNPESAMPPFGRHKIISEQEIDQLTTFIWSL